MAREWFDKLSTSWAVTHSSKVIRRPEMDGFPWLGKPRSAGRASLRSGNLPGDLTIHVWTLRDHRLFSTCHCRSPRDDGEALDEPERVCSRTCCRPLRA
jgi:hypothetical protein